MINKTKRYVQYTYSPDRLEEEMRPIRSNPIYFKTHQKAVEYKPIESNLKIKQVKQIISKIKKSLRLVKYPYHLQSQPAE